MYKGKWKTARPTTAHRMSTHKSRTLQLIYSTTFVSLTNTITLYTKHSSGIEHNTIIYYINTFNHIIFSLLYLFIQYYYILYKYNQSYRKHFLCLILHNVFYCLILIYIPTILYLLI